VDRDFEKFIEFVHKLNQKRIDQKKSRKKEQMADISLPVPQAFTRTRGQRATKLAQRTDSNTFIMKPSLTPSHTILKDRYLTE